MNGKAGEMFRKDRLLIATLTSLALLMAAATATGQQVTVLHNFAGPTSDGANPVAGLIADSSGNLYGTTMAGGTGSCTNSNGATVGCGTVFELVSSSGTYTKKLLYSFAGGADGATPQAGLIMDSNGSLYGTTSAGGNGSCIAPYTGVVGGCGTVFELVNSSGTYSEKVLYSFAGGSDGASPLSSLYMNSAGDLFGTTFAGGGLGKCQDLYSVNYIGCGTVFELVNPAVIDPQHPGYTEKVLYTFGTATDYYGNSYDGADPRGALIADKSGNLFGTTAAGGSGSQSLGDCYDMNIVNVSLTGCGTVFELVNSNGTYSYKELWGFYGPALGSFSDADGAFPIAGLAMDSSGNLYGTTVDGGPNSVGIVFELVASSNGSYAYNVLHTFSGGSDGANPYSPVLLGKAGEIYGTTRNGGGSGRGTVFRLENPSGAYVDKTLHSFTGSPDGMLPQAGLMMDQSGNLYSTTLGGGSSNLGTVFKLSFCPSTTTTTTVTSSPDPANAGDSVVLSAAVANTCGAPASGSVEFLEGSTSLGTATLDSSGSGSVTIEDADLLGIGTFTITAQYTPDYADYAASTGTGTGTVEETGAAITTGSNTFTGNQTVNGTLAATAFTGDGSGLTNVLAAGLNCTGCVGDPQLGINYAGSTSKGGPALSADSATTADSSLFANSAGALTLGTVTVPAGSFARLDVGNNFTGNQTVSGNETVSGSLVLPALNAKSANSASQALQLAGTDANKGPLLFNWAVNPSGNLDLSNGTSDTGLSITNAGLINFASGQTFPGTGTGTITGVNAGTGLTGGGSTGSVTLNVNQGVVAFQTDLTTGVNTAETVAEADATTAANDALSAAKDYADTADTKFVPKTGGTMTGTLNVPTLDVSSNETVSGSLVLPALNAKSANSASQALQFAGTDANSNPLLFNWAVDTGGNLDLSNGTGDTGLSITNAGIINFATGQTFPGTITGVTAGYGLTGSETGGSVALAVDKSVVASQTDLANGVTSAENTAEANSVSKAGDTMTGTLAVPTLIIGSGGITFDSGTTITNRFSVVEPAAFNEKIKPTSCTVWSTTAISSAADGDTVVATLSNSLMSSDIVFSAWASTGKVTVRICNPTGKPTNVGSGSIRIDLWKH